MMKINGYTNVCMIIGNPVGHSLSPLMHNAAFSQLGLNWVYLPCQVREDLLPAAIAGLRGLNIKGANVTIPYKEKVIPLLDQITPEAKMMGAVNTIVNKAGLLVGDNTDGAGFVRSLTEAGFNSQGKRLVIVGTGGAAKGVASALGQLQPEEICLVYRSVEKALELKGILTSVFAGEIQLISLENKKHLDDCLQKAHLLVHTTPVGMFPNLDQEPLISLTAAHNHLVVAELIYNPLATMLLKKAQELGCQTLSGLGMFIYQGALAFELWTGQPPPVKVMKDIVLKEMKRS